MIPFFLGELSAQVAADSAEFFDPASAALAGLPLLIFGFWILRATLPRIGRVLLERGAPAASIFWTATEIAFAACVILLGMELSFFGLRQLAMESVLDSLLATDFGLLLGCVAAYAGGVLATQRQRPGLSRSDALSLTASGMGLAPGVCGARLLKLAVYGGFGVFLAVPVILGVMSVNPYLLELIGYEFATQDVLVSLISMSGVGLVGGLMLATFVGPILEEVLFRGFVQPLAVQGLGPLAGVVLTSLLFGLIHGTAAFLPVFTLSLVLGILRQNSGHLLPAIVAHCLWNAGTMALSL